MLGQEPVATIGRDELKGKLDKGESIKLIMALNRWAFDAKHIPGSIHFDNPDDLYSALNKDDEIIVYCSNVDCLSSVALYRALVSADSETFVVTRGGCSSGRRRGSSSRETRCKSQRCLLLVVLDGAYAADGGIIGIAIRVDRGSPLSQQVRHWIKPLGDESQHPT